MDLLVERSRDGSPSCRAGPIHLHSPYSPQREAERFVAAIDAGKRPAIIVLLGPCLDYLSPLLRTRFPGCQIIRVQYDAGFRGLEIGSPDASWYPDSGLGLDSFLDTAIGEDAVSGLMVLTWAPAEEAFPEAARGCARALGASLDRLSSSAATVRFYGRRWFANACRSFLLVRRIVEPARTAIPIVIAAAGPSLGASLRDLAPLRSGFALIAVSSALAACRAGGIEPDLVVASDGGAWSRPHLYPLASRPAPLAAALGALPSASIYARIPVLPLSQGSFVETELAPLLGGGIRLPPHGTVAGTAIQLAAILGTGPILLAGLDLAAKGEQEHAAPHAFDILLGGSSSRLDSQEGRAFSRRLGNAPTVLADGKWRVSRSLSAYAGALAEDARALSGRLFRLRPSPIELEGFSCIEADMLGSVMGAGPGRGKASLLVSSVHESGPASDRGRVTLLARRFDAWRGMAAEAARELGEGRLPADARRAEFLRSIDLPDWAAGRRAAISGGDPGPAARALAASVELFLVELQRRLLG